MSLQRGSMRSNSSSFFFMRVLGASDPSHDRLKTNRASATTPRHAPHLPLHASARASAVHDMRV